MAQDEVVKRAKSYRVAKYNSDKAGASANTRVSNTSPAGGNKLKSILADAPSVQAPQEEPNDFWSGVGEALDKPIIKQLVDAISVGTYSAGNYTNDAVDAVKKGDVLSGVLGALSPIKAVGEGVLGAVGNKDYQKTQGESIRKVQEMNGIDPNSDPSKNVQFWGGLVGDVALDPTTYVGAGLATAAIKGARRGSKAFKAEKALAKEEGTVLPEHIEPTQWGNAKKQASEEMNKYRQDKIDVKQGKQIRKDFKKKSDTDKVEFLVENINTLQPAVFRALVKNVDEPDKLLDKLMEAPTSKLDEVANKLDPDTPDIPVGAIDETPSVGLSQVKPPTADEKLYDILGQLRTTDKTPRYSPEVIKNLGLAQKAAEARKVTGKVPDVKATIAKLRAYDDSERAFKKEMGLEGGAEHPYKTTDGKRYSLTTEDLINNLDPKDANFLKAFEALDDEFKAYKKEGGGALNDEQLRKLGIRNEDIPLVKQGVKVEEIADEIGVGTIGSIARDIRNGEIPDTALKAFYDIAGSTDRKAIADFIETSTKTEGFKKASQALAKYGSHRTGIPLPHFGTSGHGLNAIPDKKFTADDILSAKTPANPDQSIKFLNAKYEESALKLASLPEGASLRVLADDVFKATIDVQRAPAGKLRTKRGASTKGPNTTAKFETKYNTHSAMHRISIITNELRKMDAFKANRNKFDDAYMAVMKDVDDRLRLAGFDPHLSNMRIMGDKLVVRLAPSDVFGAMTKTQRINYIHGNPHSKTISREFLPTTILDMAEVLVRSATRLGPDGQIDFKALVTNATHTLQGKFDSLGRGKREINKNLDVNTRLKNDQEILRVLDKGTAENYAKLHREAKTIADKDAVVQTAMTKHPTEFTDISKRRMGDVPLELMNIFTKGLEAGKPSILSELINTNMRNASVFGGTVAKQIGEATAEYTAKVINALDTGTPGDFLSELVTRPPYKTADPVAQKLVSEGMAKGALAAATPEELAHAKASKAGDTTAAYQHDTDVLTEVAKAPEAINTEKLFDLSIRERNRDLLWRMYGTSRYFNKRAGMQHSFETISQSAHASALLMTGFHGIIRGWRANGWTSEQLRVALNAIKNDLPMDEISTELNAVINNMFDSSKMNFLDRNSVGPAHFNKILEKVGFDEKFRVNPAATPEEMMNTWKSWDITHVEDFLSKMMTAMVKTAEDVSMGASFSKNFGIANPTAAQIAKERLVKLVDNSKENPFFPLINKDLYYPQELANEMVYIGRLMTESRSFKPGGKTHTFVTKVMDPVISTLKMTQTTMKPGHHVMSVIGDMWRNNLALSTVGIVNPSRQNKLYFESARILRSAVGDIDELSEFTRFDRIQGVTSQLKVGSTLQGGFEVYPNIGNGGKITHNDIYALMQAKGVALPQHLGGMAEDFLTDYSPTVGDTGSKIINGIDRGTQAIDRVFNPLKPKFGMKQPYSLNKFSANRDTWTRGALFLGAMRSRKFKTVDEAATYAADFVKKWSPTAIDLGGFETKIMRRSIFYYTWLRGMVPRIIEGTLMRPGVALIPNKAMYNLGQANGLDLNSIGDPFPDDTFFPSWYKDKVLGPQWQAGGDLWGFNPTGPLGDVLNSLGSGVKPKDFVTPDAYTQTAGTFLNMSTPWFKAPMELIQGKTLQSGAPIEDPFQYLQDMIGPARTASRVTGKDLYPAVGPDGVGLPNRTEKKFRNGMTEGETAENAIPELLNWLSGMQFTNYTSDSASNSAYYQEKQKGIDKHKNNERFQ